MMDFFRTKKGKLIALCVLLLAVAIGVLSACIVSLIRNRPAEQKMLLQWDFNEGLGSFTHEMYTQGNSAFNVLTSGGVDNSGCVQIISTANNDARFLYKVNNARPNTFYRISAWVKTENVSNNGVGANITVMNTFERSNEIYGTNDWQQIVLYGRTDKEQDSFTVALRLGFYSGDNTGTVWFDNVEIEQLSALPEGVSKYISFKDTLSGSSDVSSDGTVKNANYDDNMRVAGIVFLFVAVAFVISYRAVSADDKKKALEKAYDEAEQAEGVAPDNSVRNVVIIMVIIGLVLRVFLSGTEIQYHRDVNLFQWWGTMGAEKGFSELYNTAAPDYPPLYLYFLTGCGYIAKTFELTNSVAYDMLIKVPAIVCDCLIAIFLYKLCQKALNGKPLSKNWTLLVVAAWLFNPVVILDSACWGQIDSMLTLFFIMTMYYINEQKFYRASISIALAVLLKPQGIILVPILGFAMLKLIFKAFKAKENKAKEIFSKVFLLVRCLVLAAGVIVVVSLPFIMTMGFKWLFQLYFGTLDHYAYATVNSLNFFYLIGGNWIGDSNELWMGMSWYTWGMVAILAIGFTTWAIYQKAKDTKWLPYLTGALLLFFAVTFGPRMHERYFFPALALLLCAAVLANNKVLMYLFAAMSSVNFFAVFEIMTDLNVGDQLYNAGAGADQYGYFYWPPLNGWRGALSFGNVLIACGLLVVCVGIIFGKFKLNSNRLKIWKGHDELEKDR